MIDSTVSIIIPTFNRKHILMKTLDSYLSQSNLYEVIVVDDGSTDGTYEYLQEKAKFSKITFVRHNRNTDLANARNTGIDIAKGKYLMLGEDDVFLSASYISTLLKCLEESNADLIAGRILYLRHRETHEECFNRYEKFKKPLIHYWSISIRFQKKVERDIPVPHLHALTLGKAEVYKKIRFAATSIAREDTDFCIRASKHGYKIFFCPHTICVHLPRDRKKSGQWKLGVLKRLRLNMKGNFDLINNHFDYFKREGLKGNRYTYILVHLINQIKLGCRYYFRGQ